MKSAIYRCGNKRCPEYHVEFKGMLPSEYKMATGRSASCRGCGQPVFFLRTTEAGEPINVKS